ncbi:MAG: hypothetical protein QF464_01440 [Myxococcota bacterium]|nr:hypothetical protein [Myxococcota bacterium]
MRATITLVGLTGLLSLSPFALASPGPMSPEELTENSSLIAHGQITEVLCNGEAVDNGTFTTTAYLATLTIDEVIKGDPVDQVTLPFAKDAYHEGEFPPLCSGGPSYQLGHKGTYYLQTGANTELYTLTSSVNGFQPDEDSAGEELPSCEASAEPDAMATEDVSESTEDVTEVGPEADATPEPTEDATPEPQFPDITGPDPECPDDADCDNGAGTCVSGECTSPPSEPICTEDSDCPEGQECVWTDSVTSDCVPTEGTDSSDAGSSSAGEDGGSTVDSAGSAPSEDTVAGGDGGADGSGTGSSESGSSGGGDSGGCASGGSHAPLTLALLTLGLAALSSRRRMLDFGVSD